MFACNLNRLMADLDLSVSLSLKTRGYEIRDLRCEIYCQQARRLVTGQARLIRSHSSASFCFDLSGIRNNSKILNMK